MKEKKATWPVGGAMVSFCGPFEGGKGERRRKKRGRGKGGYDRTGISEYDIRHGQKARREVRLHRRIDLLVPRPRHPDTDHRDEHGPKDGDEARDAQIADFMQRPRQAADQAHHQPHDPKHDRARRVLGDGVHHDGEGEDMAAHDEDEEEHLRCTEDLAPDGPKHHFACVRHVVDVWVG